MDTSDPIFFYKTKNISLNDVIILPAAYAYHLPSIIRTYIYVAQHGPKIKILCQNERVPKLLKLKTEYHPF